MPNNTKLVITNQHCRYQVDPEYKEHVLKLISNKLEHLSNIISLMTDDYINWDTIFRYSKMALEISRNNETSLLDARDIHLLGRLEIIPWKRDDRYFPNIVIRDLPTDDPLDPYIKVMRSVMVG